MESSERSRREREIDELCEEVDRKVESFITGLNQAKDVALIKHMRNLHERVKFERKAALVIYKRDLFNLYLRHEQGSPLANQLEESYLLLYRSAVNASHTVIVYQMSAWRNTHKS